MLIGLTVLEEVDSRFPPCLADAMSSGVMTPNALLAAPSTPSFATVGLSTMQQYVDKETIPPLEEALAEAATAKQAMTQSEKVFLLAKAQRDTCKTRLQLATHMVAEAKKAEKQKGKAKPKDRKQDTKKHKKDKRKEKALHKKNNEGSGTGSATTHEEIEEDMVGEGGIRDLLEDRRTDPASQLQVSKYLGIHRQLRQAL
ncbi:unnamed protein product [Symbiodinium natans]|uniref:Uncharacterized protein n=1 Tax=Symbiodinium natans TaxID=878477 RepID=A0A812KUU5_9DINO|nr:unnamed protein product [Symbiodinium natans]